MNNSDLFDSFLNPAKLIEQQTQNSNQRATYTVAETVKHGMIHTKSPHPTIHHTVIAACPHPTRDLAKQGKFYMLAYVSIPTKWLEAIDDEFGSTWDITFVGPSGTVQKLMPTMADMEDVLGERIYIGFDWGWLGGEPRIQPSADSILRRLTEFVSAVRLRMEPELGV